MNKNYLDVLIKLGRKRMEELALELGRTRHTQEFYDAASSWTSILKVQSKMTVA
ncbi:hypothetical protein [Desulforamulus reducens]|uniref:hypothetical protein n=1 Tax=Desulforamulus reducens TaxID=59610 RepID=UPI0002E5DAF0|nr:hypothetical protein [Desulforamulus reducens]